MKGRKLIDMRSIIEALKNGDAKERLAVIADIASLVGLSVASVAGGVLAFAANNNRLNVENVLGISILTLAGLAGLCCIVMLFIWLLSAFSKPWSTPPGIKPLVKCVVWIGFIIAMLWSIGFMYALLSSIRFSG